MSKNPSLEQILKAAPMLCRASLEIEPFSTTTLRASLPDGTAISEEMIDGLLEKCRLGQRVEIDVRMLAFEQWDYERFPDKDNRNFVGFRPGEMRSLGGTGKRKPFLRDHEQGDSMARGGTLIESKTEQPEEGHHQIWQTVRLSAPWAVEMYLRGLMTTVSIGWIPTGPVLCSACQSPIGEKCWHWPGSRLAEVTDEDGTKRYVRSAKGSVLVRWIYTRAVLIETSCVPVPGVPTAEMDQLRATLAACFPALAIDSTDDESQPEPIAADKSTLSPAPHSVKPQPETSMADQQPDQTPKLASLRKALVTALTLTPEHRAYAVTLSADDAETFCGENPSVREVAVQAALDADPIVFVGALTGFKVRRSEGERTKQFAEAAEQAAAANKQHEATLAERAAAAETAEIRTICGKQLSHLPGSNETHELIVRSLRTSGAPKEQIDAAIKALGAASMNVAKQARAPGASYEEDPAADGPQAAFDALVAKHVTDHKVDERDARLAVVKTERGRALYNECERNKKYGRAAVA